MPTLLPSLKFRNMGLEVMRRLWSDNEEVDLTMAVQQRAMQRAKAAGEVTWGDMLLRPTPGSRLMLIVVIGVALFQQMSGVEVVTVYTPIILQDQVGTWCPPFLPPSLGNHAHTQPPLPSQPRPAA